jgi:type VI secretion system secreted protein Hcp
MATDIFIKIDDLQGESNDAKHKGEIEVLTWSWAMSQKGTAHSGTGAGTSKVKVADLRFVKHVDKASPNLMKLCCNGKPFSRALLTVRKAGGDSVEYVKLEMLDGIISSVTHVGKPHEARLMENVTLNFASFTYEYTPQTASGAGGGSIPARWNIAKNSPS